MSDAHKALKDIPLPKRMLNCQRDKRGYPIPFLMIPDQQILIDGRKQERCAMQKLCMICGKKLDNKKWFIGGHHAAQNRLFTDPAMHEECARYAIRVCPFLSNPSMKYRKKYDEDTDFFLGAFPGTTTQRSETNVLLRTNGYKAVWWRDHAYILANAWEYIEHWHDGARVSDPEGLALIDLCYTNGIFDPGGRYYDQLKEIR
jgi:hypothetical protein